jgi:hypothetical protein
MRQYPIGTSEHCDRFVKWFNDAVAVLDTHAKAPSVPYSTLLGAAAAPAAPAAPAAQSIWPPALALDALNYDVPGTVTHVTQPTGKTCWAASGTTMQSWKVGSVRTIDQMLSAVGGPWKGIFDASRGIDQTELVAFTRALGMTSELPMCYAPQGIDNLLRAHGPLWIEADYDNPSNNNVHAVVITGIHGDGTVSGTSVTVHDPLRPAPYTLAFDQFGPRMETPDMVNLGVQVFHF